MFKSIVLATAAIAAASTASAGDYQGTVVEAAPVFAPRALVGWTGAYIGASANFGDAKVKASGAYANELAAAGVGRTASEPDGTSFALRAGRDWQVGHGVFGFGAEYNFGGYKADINDAVLNYDGSTSGSVKIEKAFTVFTRVGYAVDKWMGYGVLGYTWADLKAREDSDRINRDLDGLTYGLGAAYSFDKNWSAFAEYTITDFGKIEKSGGNSKADLRQVKLGVNYRF